jgi:hypothetical protein
MRSCSETCSWATDLIAGNPVVDRCDGTPISVGPDVHVVKGHQRVCKSAVTTAAARAQGSGARCHSEMPATIAVNEADEAQSAHQPDVQGHRHEHD